MLNVKLLLAGLAFAVVGALGLVTPVSTYAASSPSIALHVSLPTGASTLATSAGPALSTTLLTQDITGTITGTTTSTVTGTITGTTTSTVSSTVPVAGPNKIAGAITSYFSSTAVIEEVLSMHASGMGFGEIFRLYQLALLSGETTDDIHAMRESGMGWGEIAHNLGVPPGNKGANLGAAVSGRSETGGGKPENPGNSNGNGNKPSVTTGGNSNGEGNQPSVNNNGGGNGKGSPPENRGAGGNGKGKGK